jgi:hypothetical protein
MVTPPRPAANPNGVPVDAQDFEFGRPPANPQGAPEGALDFEYTATKDGYTVTFGVTMYKQYRRVNAVTMRPTDVAEGLPSPLPVVDLTEALTDAVLGPAIVEWFRSAERFAEWAKTVLPRPSRIGDDFLAEVVAAVAADGVKGATTSYGVSERTVRRWLALARDRGLR